MHKHFLIDQQLGGDEGARITSSNCTWQVLSGLGQLSQWIGFTDNMLWDLSPAPKFWNILDRMNVQHRTYQSRREKTHDVVVVQMQSSKWRSVDVMLVLQTIGT